MKPWQVLGFRDCSIGRDFATGGIASLAQDVTKSLMLSRLAVTAQQLRNEQDERREYLVALEFIAKVREGLKSAERAFYHGEFVASGTKLFEIRKELELPVAWTSDKDDEERNEEKVQAFHLLEDQYASCYSKEDAWKAAMALLKKTPEVESLPPNALQMISGAAVAGVIALVLYKFSVTVEGGFLAKAVSMNYSIRNLTITIRRIVTGMCYLATFVFAANGIGLTLLSLQLVLVMGDESNPKPNDSNIQSSRERRMILSERIPVRFLFSIRMQSFAMVADAQEIL